MALESPDGGGMMMRLSQPVAAYLAGMLTVRAGVILDKEVTAR